MTPPAAPSTQDSVAVAAANADAQSTNQATKSEQSSANASSSAISTAGLSASQIKNAKKRAAAKAKKAEATKASDNTESATELSESIEKLQIKDQQPKDDDAESGDESENDDENTATAADGSAAASTDAKKKRKKRKSKKKSPHAANMMSAPVADQFAGATMVLHLNTTGVSRYNANNAATQTNPQLTPPTLPVSTLFKDRIFPEGQLQPHGGEMNVWRSTKAELIEQDRIANSLTLSQVREAAEVHRQVRRESVTRHATV